MEFGKRLKMLRQERGLSQQKLADMIFISRSAVAKWESGLGLPSEESYDALATVFGISKESLKAAIPERIVIEKNRTIQKLSVSVWTVGFIAVAILLAYGLFRPMPYCASAGWDKIFIQPVSEHTTPFEITEKAEVEHFIDLLNSLSLRKSLRPSSEAPDSIKGIFSIRGDDGTGNDIWLCASMQNKFTVYIWTGTQEFVVSDADAFADHLLRLLQDHDAVPNRTQ